MDIGWAGNSRFSMGGMLKPMNKYQYYSNCDFLYSLMNFFYLENLPLIYEDVHSFYRNKLFVIPDNKGILNLTVAIDGSFSHVGYHSSGGVSFVIEIITGRTIDYNYIVLFLCCL